MIEGYYCEDCLEIKKDNCSGLLSFRMFGCVGTGPHTLKCEKAARCIQDWWKWHKIPENDSDDEECVIVGNILMNV